MTMNKEQLLKKMDAARALINLMPEDVKFLTLQIDNFREFNYIHLVRGGIQKLMESGMIDKNVLTTKDDPERKYIEVSFEANGFQVLQSEARD